MKLILPIQLLSLAQQVRSQINLFSGGTATFDPSPGLPQSALNEVIDGKILPATPTTDWGVCSGQTTSNIASIVITVLAPKRVRTIITTFTAAGCSGSATLSSETFQQTITNCATNSHYYSPSLFQTTILKLEVTSWLAPTTSKRMCSPEIMVVDSHPLWGVSPTRTQTAYRTLNFNSGTHTYDTINLLAITSNTFVADSTCYSNTLGATDKNVNLSLVLGSTQTISGVTTIKTNSLLLLTGFYVVLGPSNTVSDMGFYSWNVDINFAAKTAVQVPGSVGVFVNKSGFYSTSNTNGQIIHGLRLETSKQGVFQICRIMPLGFSYCFIDSISDTTVSTNTYLIRPSSPKVAIQKVFQIGFHIDEGKVIQNILFCSLGLSTTTTTVTCLTCPSVQPSISILITQDGKITVSVSTTSFTNIGLQTFEIKVDDTRNAEQSTGMATTFKVTFTTCSLSFTAPQNVDYMVGSPAGTQTITATEDDTCGFGVNCSLDPSSPIWISNTGCTFNWNSSCNLAELVNPLKTIPITITYSKQPTSETFTTSFKIQLQTQVPTYLIESPNNVDYELFSDAATQQIMVRLSQTSASLCGQTVVCSLQTAPPWASINDCKVEWQSSDTQIATLSTHKVQILVSYVDVYGVLWLIGTPQFYITVTAATTLCKTAQLIQSTHSMIQLEYKKELTFDFTPTDSVSTLFAQLNYCGPYSFVWPSSPVPWLTITSEKSILSLTQNEYKTEKVESQIQISLVNYPTRNMTQIIHIQPKSCSVTSLKPTINSITQDYVLGNNFTASLPQFLVSTDCEIKFNYYITVAQVQGKTVDSSFITLSTTNFQIILVDATFEGTLLVFEITATLNDESKTKNSSLKITLNVKSKSQNSSTTPTSTSNAQNDQQSSDGPSFSSQLQITENIPCLNLEQVKTWIYETPTIVPADKKIVDFELSCPGIQNIFKVELANQQLIIKLDMSSDQPYPGYYPASITLKFQGEKTETKFQTSFVVDCDAKFAKAKLKTRPSPRILKITGTGTVFVVWNETLITPVANLTQLNTSQVLVGSTKVPSIQVQIKPGQIDYDKSEIKFNFTVTGIDQRSLTLQIYFENPSSVSVSNHAMDEVMITFNEASLFTSSSNKMSVQQALKIYGTLPRQSNHDKVQLKTETAVKVTKAAMLASLGMPFVLSAFLAQLVSLIRSFTLIVHMQAISLMYPSNVVKFMSVLAPLVMFDLIPSQDFANRIFQFDAQQERSPLSLQFGELGYPSLLLTENIGSLIFMICAYPIIILFFFVLKKLLIRYLNGKKFSQKLIKLCDSQVKSAFWNGPIRFLFESYFITCLISLIGFQQLVFTDYQVWNQVLCSVLAVIGVFISVVFPIFIAVVYKLKLINNEPAPDPTDMTLSARMAEFWVDDDESIFELYFTQKQMSEFSDKYGCLIKEVDINRVGVNAAILYPVSEMVRKLIICVALVYGVKYPNFVIFTFNFTTLCYLGIQMYVLPMKDPIENVRLVMNEVTVLLVVYHMFCFTDFVGSIGAQDMAGDSVIQVIIINGSINVILSLIVPVRSIHLNLRKLYERCRQKFKKTRQIAQKIQIPQPTKYPNLANVPEAQPPHINKAVRRQTIVVSLTTIDQNGFVHLPPLRRVNFQVAADRVQTFSQSNLPSLGNISPVSQSSPHAQIEEEKVEKSENSENNLFDYQQYRLPMRYATLGNQSMQLFVELQNELAEIEEYDLQAVADRTYNLNKIRVFDDDEEALF